MYLEVLTRLRTIEATRFNTTFGKSLKSFNRGTPREGFLIPLPRSIEY